MNSVIFRNGRVIDSSRKTIEHKDVFVSEGKISFSPKQAEYQEVIDLYGAYISPGFLAGNIKLDESLLSPLEFAKAVSKKGTTAIFIDASTITNILGVKGIQLFLEQAEISPISTFIGIPPFVPSSNIETFGGELTGVDVGYYTKRDKVYSLENRQNPPSFKGLTDFGAVENFSAEDIKNRGHINFLLMEAARAISHKTGKGIEEAFLEALPIVTINAAKYFNKPNMGNIEEGSQADLIVFDSIEDINPKIVMSKGNFIVRHGEYVGPYPSFNYQKYEHPLRIDTEFVSRLIVSSDNLKEKVRVIEAKENSILTEEKAVEMDVIDFIVRPKPEDGIRKLAVLERHKRTGNISVGFVKGFDFFEGAIASTVAHNAYNLIVMGDNEISMVRAIEIVWTNRGGMSAVLGEEEAFLPLAVGGLLSTEDIDTVIRQKEMLKFLLDKMGFSHDPFKRMSYLSKPSLPNLRLTDKGLVDAKKLSFLSLFV